MPTETTDVIIIGSGIGGLCGAAHGFERDGYHFDSGPSLYSGMSCSPSPNPLRQVPDTMALRSPLAKRCFPAPKRRAKDCCAVVTLRFQALAYQRSPPAACRSS